MPRTQRFHPFFVVSVALRQQRKTTIAAVYCPGFNTMYHTEAAQGAYRNGRSIHVSSTDTLINALVGTGS
ncbi:MAG: hypothetical protein K9N51_06895 [Candidatus Pacebacteria bacterium]|nr:hypothetical protein [Candidatus Paceibacterota bacterium]